MARVAALCLALPSLVLAEDTAAAMRQRIEFPSHTPASRWELARGTPGAPLSGRLTIWGDLLMPRGDGQRVPAVVISHGSEGVSALYYDVWAKALLAAGYAVFIVDSQKPRGIERNLGALQIGWNTTANIADGLHAFGVLAKHPGIEPERIFHMGFSRGAAASYATAWPIYHEALLPPGPRYAGHVAIYPGCNLRYHEQLSGTNTAPVLMLLAEKDDMTPAAPCVEYAQQLATEGHRVSYKLYSGAHHVFDRLDQPYSRSWQGTYADCSLEYTVTNGRTRPTEYRWGNYRTGERFMAHADWERALGECAKEKRITAQSHPQAREAAVRDVLAFFEGIRASRAADAKPAQPAAGQERPDPVKGLTELAQRLKRGEITQEQFDEESRKLMSRM